MFGFNWVDVLVLALLLLAAIEGARIGVLSQLFLWVGFFVTLFVAGWLFPYLLPIHDPTIRSVINGTAVFLTAAYAGFRCLDVGQNVHWSFRLGVLRSRRSFKLLETVLGAVPGIVAGLVLVWLMGV